MTGGASCPKVKVVMVKSVGLTQRTLESQQESSCGRLAKGILLTNAVVLKQPKAERPQGGSDWSKMSYFYTRVKDA